MTPTPPTPLPGPAAAQPAFRRVMRGMAAWLLRRPHDTDLFFVNLRQTARTIWRAIHQRP
jgi:hypothetical protein